MKILVLNGGSSTFKCWFQDVPDGKIWTARAEWKATERAEDRLEPLLGSLWQGENKAIDSPAESQTLSERLNLIDQNAVVCSRNNM